MGELEAIINGNPLDTIDPIFSVRIIINNGAHDYEYEPDGPWTLEIRRMESGAASA